MIHHFRENDQVWYMQPIESRPAIKVYIIKLLNDNEAEVRSETYVEGRFNNGVVKIEDLAFDMNRKYGDVWPKDRYTLHPLV